MYRSRVLCLRTFARYSVACLALLTLSERASAAGFEYDFGILPLVYDANNPENGGWVMPDDMLRPNEEVIIKIGNGPHTSQAEVGTMISPSWMITAGHSAKNGPDIDPNWANGSIFHGLNHDGSYTSYRAESLVILTSHDIALVKLQDASGVTASMDHYISVTEADKIELTGQRYVRATRNSYMDNGAAIPGAKGKLRWGYQAINNTHADHSDYAGEGYSGGDSGNPIVTRDGLTWKLNTVVSGASNIPQNSILLADIASYVDDLPSVVTEAPTIDVLVNTPGNYLMQSAGSAISVTAGVSLTGATHYAQDLFVGDSLPGTVDVIDQDSGDVVLSGGLFLGFHADEKGDYSLSGGSLRANQVFVGYDGDSTYIHTSGSSYADSVVVGSQAGSDGLALVTGDAVSNGALLSIGRRAGATGSIYLSGASAEIGYATTVVGQSGIGSFTLNEGTHSVDSLVVGANSGATGFYAMSGGELNASTIVVGDNGHGTLTQTGGVANTATLKSNSTSQILVSSGATMLTGNATLTGSLDVTGSGVFGVSRIGDLSAATISATGGGTILSGAEGLLIVDAATGNAIANGSLTILAAGQPIHVKGTPLHVIDHAIRGTYAFTDEVNLTGVAAILAEDGPITLNNGLSKSVSSTVHLGGGRLVVQHGRNGIGNPSVVSAATGTFADGRITVANHGHLVLEGHIDAPNSNGNLSPNGASMNVEGVLEIGDMMGYAILGSGAVFEDGRTVLFRNDSELHIDIRNHGAESISAQRALIEEGSILKLDIAASEIASLPYMTEMPLIELASPISVAGVAFVGTFDEVIYGESSYNDLFIQSRAVAVLYNGESIEGGTAISGVSAVVTLPGDFNLDGRVGDADLTILLQNWGSTNATWSSGDVNGDGIVGDAELTAILTFNGQDISQQSGSAAPEPSACILSISLLALVASQCSRGSSKAASSRS